MNQTTQLPNRRRRRMVIRTIACGVLVALPACRMPELRHAEPAPDLPGSFTSLAGTPDMLPANGTIVGSVIPSGPSAPGRAAILPASGQSGPTGIIPASAGERPQTAPSTTSTSLSIPDPKTVATAIPVGQATGTPISGAVLIHADEPAAGPTGSVNSAQLGVEEFYNDPLLTRLIQQAVAGNRELKLLEQEVQIASNLILARRGAYLPIVSIGADSGIEKTSKFTRNGSVEEQLLLRPRDRTFPDPLPNTRAGINVFWQLDIWRQLRNSRDAAMQSYFAAIERRNAYVTRLVAETAENYYQLMALDKRMENLDQTIKLQEQSLEIAKTKKENARGTELPVQRFLAEVRKNQSEKLIITQEIIEVENRINFLINRYPAPIERASETFYDLTIHALSVGIPSQLLLNRPDIRQAERELQAAGLDVKVARANFYPTLSISAGVGYEAFNPRYLFRPEAFAANVLGSLVAPLINKKAIQADYLSANARQLEAIYNYQRVVLNAFTEVVNSISKVENYRQSIEIKKQQLESLKSSVETATQLFQNARAEYIEVLFAQRDLRDARMMLIDTKREQLSAIVNAYQALGGGNTLSQPTTVPPPTVPMTRQSIWDMRK